MIRALSFRGLFLLALVVFLPSLAAAQQTQQRPVASPRDTARMKVAGGEVIVDYGRPSARGRKIMGGLVPFGRVWRTGANAATTLVTPVDLRIGGTAVRKGTYTLYTIPARNGWTLIVNRQTGQWGTQYDAARDLARIPMRVSALTRPVETFTIALSPGTGGRGEMTLSWENTRVSVPVVVGR